MSNQLTIGEYLRRARLEAEYKQSEMAELISYDPSVVSKVERNKQLPTGEYLSRVTDVLQLSDLDLKMISELLESASMRPDLMQKAILRGHAGVLDQFEIEMYWGYRPTAHHDLRDAILGAQSELFLSGMALTTIADVLNDPKVIESIAAKFASDRPFFFTIVRLERSIQLRLTEAGGSELQQKIDRGTRALRRFNSSLSRLVPDHPTKDLVEYKTYPHDVIPRHFVLKADETLYVGSYLSHQQGSYSYLMS